MHCGDKRRKNCPDVIYFFLFDVIYIFQKKNFFGPDNKLKLFYLSGKEIGIQNI